MAKYCPKCGTKNHDDVVYCIKCGYKFPLEFFPRSGFN
ncbi:MAG: zinc-ribbon domain-containing protein [Nitrososphaeria archaeon]